MSKKGIAQAVSCMSFSPDGSQVALSPNTSEVLIYQTNGSQDTSKWTLSHTLQEHSEFVSALDWSPVNNMIVSCSHDRNAYVWKYEEDKKTWSPTLVILRINRAATAVKWSPDGNKFAVASGAKCVPVCHFEAEQNWWVSKMIKKHKSTVLTLDWCVNNKFLVTGGSDNKCRIFSAYIKNVDNPEDDGFGDVFPNQHKFGEVLAEFDAGKSWVESVTWSPAGFRLAFSAHNSTVTFVQLLAGGEPITQTVRHKGLPFMQVRFVDDNNVAAVGWDCVPYVFQASGDDANPDWTAAPRSLDKMEGEVKKAGPSKFAAAKNMFASAVTKGQGADKSSVKLKTKHQNTITAVQPVPGKEGEIATCGVDGHVFFWKL